MTKKIAILTQPLITNYGGTLQAFALQKVIKDLGYCVETINYQNVQNSKLYEILSTLKNFIVNRKYVFYFSNKEKSIIRKEHNRFIKKNISYSKPINNVQTLEQYFKEQKFDSVIVGSDQVWREAYSPRIESFFLDFLVDNTHIKKIVYSASFGIDKWQFGKQKTEELKELCRKIPFISVREDSAVYLCNRYLDKLVEHTLDPTLLLSKTDYLSIIPELGGKNMSKIFTYILDDNINTNSIVDFICGYLGKESFRSQPIKKNKENFFINDIDSYIYPPIEDWLNSFFQADFIITDSFHGTVFSIIFNKPFVTIINKERGASRFKSLLNELGLSNRIIENPHDIDENILINEINYSYVNDKLKDLRVKSFEFLIQALGN